MSRVKWILLVSGVGVFSPKEVGVLDMMKTEKMRNDMIGRVYFI
jgi:hypothetical protein